MGCGSSSTNWEERFAREPHQRKGVDAPDGDSAVVDVDVDIPKPSLGKWGMLCMRVMGFVFMITSLFDISTDFAVLVEFSEIGIGSFPFVFSLVTLVVGPQFLTLYEYRKNVGVGKSSAFSWGVAALNALHLRLPVQNAYGFFIDKSEGARVRMLQVKMILSLTVALPQTVLQGGMMLNDEGRELTFLKCASLAASIFSQAESMGEFCFREGNPIKIRFINATFFTFWMTPLFMNMSNLFTSSTAAAISAVTAVFLVNVGVCRVLARLYPGWSTSKTIIRYAVDGGMYTIGFFDVNFRDPVPDTILSVVTFLESGLYLALPTIIGSEAEYVVTRFILIANGCFYAAAGLTLIVLHVVKRHTAVASSATSTPVCVSQKRESVQAAN